jgi:hypothetical protein
MSACTFGTIGCPGSDCSSDYCLRAHRQMTVGGAATVDVRAVHGFDALGFPTRPEATR